MKQNFEETTIFTTHARRPEGTAKEELKLITDDLDDLDRSIIMTFDPNTSGP